MTMHPSAIAQVFEPTVLLSTGVGLALSAGLARRTKIVPDAPTSAGLGRVFAHPLTQLVLVSLLLWGNQVLFSAFVSKAHGGDVSFASRYVGPGWFAIDARSSVVQWVAAHAGDAQWLSPTLLRVQAFLELPFTLFAYLAVARMLGVSLHRRLTSLPALVLTSVSWTVTFSLVELFLHTPWTMQDIALRALSTTIVPVYVARISRAARDARSANEEAHGPTGMLGLLLFLAGAGAISYAVLAIYDAFLLYNLAHLPRYGEGLVFSLVVASLAAYGAPRVDAWAARVRGTVTSSPAPRSAAMDACVSSLRAFTLLFMVPSLSLRYRGGHSYAVVCGLVVVLVALIAGLRAAVRRALAPSGGGAVALIAMVAGGVAALVAGAWAAGMAIASATPVIGYGVPELLLARVSLAFLVASIVTFRAVEITVCWTLHEAKAQADEA